MSIEIEKKYRLTEERMDDLVNALRETNAKYVGRDFEENTIYSSEGLRSVGAILRIRKTDSRTLLTYKRRIDDDIHVKKQVEHETEVSDPAATAEIIKQLGLAPVLVYEKRRDTWKFRTVEIVIDELPFGLYMEIEGAITSIQETEMLLGLDDLETEHETYPRLTAVNGSKNGDVVESRFNREE